MVCIFFECLNYICLCFFPPDNIVNYCSSPYTWVTAPLASPESPQQQNSYRLHHSYSFFTTPYFQAFFLNFGKGVDETKECLTQTFNLNSVVISCSDPFRL